MLQPSVMRSATVSSAGETASLVLVFSQDMPRAIAVGFAAGQKRLLERLVARLPEHVVNRAERHLHARATFQKQCLCIVVHV